jgi:exo-beta-1,3-glucanase (GH17 family)
MPPYLARHALHGFAFMLFGLLSGTVQAQTTPDNINDFLNGLGVNTHASIINSAYYPYALDITTGKATFNQAKLNQLEGALQYIGINNLRDGMSTDATVDNAFPGPNGTLGQSLFQKINQDVGAKFDFMITGEDPSGHFGSFSDIVRHAGVMKFLEGPNEVDDGNWLIYVEPSGARITGIPAAETVQPYIYSTMKANPVTANIPVIQYSLGNLADFPTAGTVTAADADYGNAHIYFGTGNWPGSGNVKLVTNDGIGMTPGKPVVATEEGYPTMLNDPQQSVSEAVQAKYILSLLLDTWKQGVHNIFLYELADYWPDPTGTASREYHFGMYHNDWTPKAAATALHNFTSILKDTSTINASKPASLTYTLTGAPASVTSQLFQKNDGTFLLAVWNDVRLSGPVSETNITVAPVPVTLTLGQTAGQVQTFDPLIGTTATATAQNITTMTLNVPDHPLILTITSAAPAVDTPVVVAPATLTVAANSTTSISTASIVDPWAQTSTRNMILNLTTDLGLIRTSNVAAGTKSLQLTGSLAELNADLANLQYIAPAAAGKAHLGINPWNQAGHSVQNYILVTVTASSSPAVATPAVTAPATVTVAPVSKTAISSVSITDPAGPTSSSPITLNLTIDSGMIRTSNTAPWVRSLTVKGSLTELNAALANLQYMAPAGTGTAHLGINPVSQAGQSAQDYIQIAIAQSAMVK